MKTPFRYYGSKTMIVDEIWRRLGDPAYYYEPFAGSLSVLLNRPQPGRYEYAGDIDPMIVNFLRAAKWGAGEVAKWADYPPSSIDLEARIAWLKERRTTLSQELTDAAFFDAKCAGWYAWTQSVKISTNRNGLVLGRGAGVCRLGQDKQDYFAQLADRLKNVTFYHGDWSRLARAARRECKRTTCAILFDPPYSLETGRFPGLYDHDSLDVGSYVRRWALAAATPTLRIALCGYEGEYDMPRTWIEMPWKGKYGGLKERVWFSPDCLS